MGDGDPEQRTLGLMPRSEVWSNAPREHRALAWLAAFASIGCNPQKPRPPIDGLLDVRVLGVGGKEGLARDPNPRNQATQIPAPYAPGIGEQITERHRQYVKEWLREPDGSELALGPKASRALAWEDLREFLVSWPSRWEIQQVTGGVADGEVDLRKAFRWELKPLRHLVDERGHRLPISELWYRMRLHPSFEAVRMQEVQRSCSHREGQEETRCHDCALTGIAAVRDLVAAVLEKCREEHLQLAPARASERKSFIGTVLRAVYDTCVAGSPFMLLLEYQSLPSDLRGGLVPLPVSAFARAWRADQEGRPLAEERTWYATDGFLSRIVDEVSYWAAPVDLTFNPPLAQLFASGSYPGLAWAELLNIFSGPNPWAVLRCCRWCGRFWVAPEPQGPGRPRSRFCSDECGEKFHERGSSDKD